MALIKKTGDWVLIKHQIPVQIPIDPMAIYYALPTGNYFFKGENYIGGREEMVYKYANLFDAFERTDHFIIKSFIVDILTKSNRRKFNIETLNKFERKIHDYCKESNLTIDEFESQVKIKTIFGDVVLQPEEYAIVNDINPYLESIKDKSAVLRFLSKTEQLTGKLGDQIFYLRSRGIGYADALQLCISNIKTQNLFYIEMTPPNAAYFCRDYLSFAKKKRAFVVKNRRPDLLEYPEYTLEDFIQHLEN